MHALSKFTDRFIETGMHKAKTTLWACSCFDVVITCETDPELYAAHWAEVAGAGGTPLLMDSRRMLSGIYAHGASIYDGNDLVYLDAHCGLDLPLLEELEILLRKDPAERRICIVIDDFKVEGDPGYRYDIHNGHALCLDYIAPILASTNCKVHIYWPAVPSEQEQEPRTGCVVLLTDNFRWVAEGNPLCRLLRRHV
jgi:hypothetical protein